MEVTADNADKGMVRWRQQMFFGVPLGVPGGGSPHRKIHL